MRARVCTCVCVRAQRLSISLRQVSANEEGSRHLNRKSCAAEGDEEGEYVERVFMASKENTTSNRRVCVKSGSSGLKGSFAYVDHFVPE